MQNSDRPKLTQIPASIACVADYERLAADFIDPAVYEHIAGGSGGEQTVRANLAAFDKLEIYNRVFINAGEGSTALRLLGSTFRHPIFLAPVAQQAMVHPEGEKASARAATAMEAGMVVSTLSSFALEEIAAIGEGEKWFQLYFQSEPAHTIALVRRAEAAGYRAIVVTADAPVQPLSRRAARAGYRPPPGAPNLQNQSAAAPVVLSPDDSVVFQGMMSTAPNWDDLAWLVRETGLPVIVKGVSHPEDAERCIAAGASGIVVSNHGGRALDGAPASLAALPALRARLGKQSCILLDGGVRSGADVFKAIALGADAVMIGRPQIYALAVGGSLGVAHMLRMMRDELELCMALAGLGDLRCLTPAALFTREA